MMETLLDVVSVMPRADGTLLLVFENNEQRVFDMKPLLSEKPFTKLQDKRLFLRARVELGTVAWPGNIDVAPETLWDCSTPA